MDDIRIIVSKNSVGPATFTLGENNPISLHTDIMFLTWQLSL